MAKSNGYSASLPFEAPIVEIERQIEAIEERGDAADFAEEVTALRESRDGLLRKIYQHLSPWDTVRVARHQDRPQTADYIQRICRDFRELHGDRQFGDDPAIITGFGRIGSHKVMVIGHQKGREVEEKIECHFGCAHPEGYRKALRKMRLAEKYGLPIVTLIDTPGAYPGVRAEERGQAAAIAMNLREMSRMGTPVVSVVIGEGGSGGALGIGVADRVAMLRHSWYSVISPEGCAAILWKVSNETSNSAAAAALALTADANLSNGLIDAIIEEPLGGAHRDPVATAELVMAWIVAQLDELRRFKPETLVQRRYEKLRRIGALQERRVPAPSH